MRFSSSKILVGILLATAVPHAAMAELLSPTAATASSALVGTYTFGVPLNFNRPASATIDGLFLNATAAGDNPGAGGRMWLTEGVGVTIGTGPTLSNDTAPFITYDLGSAKTISGLVVINYNESGSGATNRGVKATEVFVGPTATGPFTSMGVYNLAQSSGTISPAAQPITFGSSVSAQFVKMQILSNQKNQSYNPYVSTTDGDFAFVGLQEVAVNVASAAVKPSPDLKVDFGQSTSSSIEAGFNTFESPVSDTATQSRMFSTPAGNILVTVSGQTGFFNRNSTPADGTPPGFTYSELYRDFAYRNGATPGAMHLALSGLVPNQLYALTLYSFDSDSSISQTNTTTFTPTNNTIGSVSSISYVNGVFPATNGMYSTTMLLTSTTDVLDLDLTALNLGANIGVRLNGFELLAIPEPSSGILALAGVFVALRNRRRRTC